MQGKRGYQGTHGESRGSPPSSLGSGTNPATLLMSRLVGKRVFPSIPLSRFDLLLPRAGCLAWGMAVGLPATCILGWGRAGVRLVRKTVSKASQGRGEAPGEPSLSSRLAALDVRG